MAETLSPEVLERAVVFERVTTAIVNEGKKQYLEAHGPEGKDPKVYHGPEHLKRMEERVERLAKIFCFSSEQLKIVKMATAWHDVVIEYDKADPANLTSRIKRHRGARKGDVPSGKEGNESISAQRLKAIMEKANKEAGSGKEIFSKEQIKAAYWGIEATYPDVALGTDYKDVPFAGDLYFQEILKQNPSLVELFSELQKRGVERGLFFSQPHLEKALEAGEDVPLEVLVVAISDLGAAGLSDREVFFEEGDGELRELLGALRLPGVMERLVTSDEEADRLDREKIGAVFFDWLNDQVGFVAWQCLRFEKIIYFLKRNKKIKLRQEKGLREYFGFYQDNLRAAQQRVEKLRKEVARIKSETGEREAFKFLAQNLHYKV